MKNNQLSEILPNLILFDGDDDEPKEVDSEQNASTTVVFASDQRAGSTPKLFQQLTKDQDNSDLSNTFVRAAAKRAGFGELSRLLAAS